MRKLEVISGCLLAFGFSACRDLATVNTGIGSGSGGVEAPTEVEEPAFSDPAMLLSDEEIIERYGNVSCESLRTLIDYLDQIGSTDYFRGLSGSIRYQTQSCRAEHGSWNHLDDFNSEEAGEVDGQIYLTRLDVPTRSFTLGFPRLDGSMVQTEEEEDLVEYFSINFRTSLKLGEVEESGWYEFAFLSDDGVRFQLEETGELIADHPDVTSTKMVCSNRAVYLEKGEALPVSIDYFQGPRNHIALMMMWRPVDDAVAGEDPACGERGTKLYHDYTKIPSEPQQAYLDLLDRGWEVVPDYVFRIPRDEYMNPCESQHVRDVINEGLSPDIGGME